MTLLVVGARGQLGIDLTRTLQAGHEVIAWDRSMADLGDPVNLREAVLNAQPTAIVNAAAYTAVDAAENDEETARLVNAVAPGTLAAAAAKMSVPFIHFGTDYVFPGTGNQALREDDPTGPLNVYGQTKLDGEAAVLLAGGNATIVRTGWVISPHGRNFVTTMNRLLSEPGKRGIVADQFGAPTHTAWLAQVTTRVLGRMLQGDTVAPLYHASSAGTATWFDVACQVADDLDLPGRPVPITTAEYPTPARRPPYAVLDSSRLARDFDIEIPRWQTAVREVTSLLRESAG